jgi:hypothetical protein
VTSFAAVDPSQPQLPQLSATGHAPAGYATSVPP